MLKRIFFVIAASLLMLGAVGCACAGGTVSPSPTASMRPVSTPSMAAESTPMAGLSASPDIAGSPDAGTPTDAGASIQNFSEGTEVKAEDVPAVKSAVESKYSGATVKTVKHALKDGQQVYEVEIEQSGRTQKIYVQPDGTVLPDSSAAS